MDNPVSLDDLLDGRDALMTSAEVAEVLNVNQNTLYLWRQSPEVCSVLPFQRFIAPGQVRGMIRYRRSDVERFIAGAQVRASQDVAAAAALFEQSPESIPGTPRPDMSDETLADWEQKMEVESELPDAADAIARLLDTLNDDSQTS